MHEVIKVVKENNSVIKRALLDRLTVIFTVGKGLSFSCPTGLLTVLNSSCEFFKRICLLGNLEFNGIGCS
jgi:hypothetical protein